MNHIKYIFNNDERGIQYLLINTNNLSDFQLSYLDTPYNNIFNELRDILEKDQEYIDFENAFLFRLYILKNRKNIIISKDDDILREKINKTSKDKFSDDFIDFLENSLKKKIYKIKFLIDLLPLYNVEYNLLKAKKDEIPNWVNYLIYKNPKNNNYFDVIDQWLSKKIKSLWDDFKNNQVSNMIISQPEDSQKIQKIYPRFGKEVYIQQGGKVVLEVKNKVECSDLGLKYDNCAIPIFQCIISSDDTFINNCLKNLSGITSDLYDDDSFSRASPEIILILLNKLGFKAIKTDDTIKIVDVDTWLENILKKKYLNFEKEFKLIEEENIKSYLKKMVDFINKTSTDYLKDKEEHRKDKLKDIDISKIKEDTTKIPIEGLIKFFEFRRANNFLPPTNTKDFMTNLYLYHDFKLPDCLQIGGSNEINESNPEDIRIPFDNGSTGYGQLKNIYDLLIKSLKNITVEKEDLNEVDKLFKEFAVLQERFLQYLIFLLKLKQVNDMFLESPLRHTLKKEDIEKLNKKFDFIVSDFKQTEDKISAILETIAREEKA
jgi:hypothetical protein